MPANFLVVKSPKIASTKVVKAKAARVLVVSKGNVPKASEEDMRRLEHLVNQRHGRTTSG